jgi:hypothetical protein
MLILTALNNVAFRAHVLLHLDMSGLSFLCSVVYKKMPRLCKYIQSSNRLRSLETLELNPATLTNNWWHRRDLYFTSKAPKLRATLKTYTSKSSTRK